MPKIIQEYYKADYVFYKYLLYQADAESMTTNT